MSTAPAPLKKYLAQVSVEPAGTIGSWEVRAESEDEARTVALAEGRRVAANVSGADMATLTCEVAQITKTYRLPRGGWTRGHGGDLACPHRDCSVCPECAERYSDRVVEVFGQHFLMGSDAERVLMLASLADVTARHGDPTARIGDTPEQRAAAFGS